MVRFEIKKIFSRTGGKIAVLLLLVLLAVTCFLAVHEVRYVNEQGEAEYGVGAARKLREAKKEWKGEVTTEQLTRVLEENRRINGTEEYCSGEARENNIAYSWKQGFSDIRDMINNAFSAFREYDYYRADSVSEEELGNFYERRIQNLRDWLEMDETAKNQFSEAEKEYLLDRYEKLQTPFFYDYADGWEKLFMWSPTIIMITVLILGFLVAGIFSCEFQLRADSVFFSSYYGRNRAIRSKLAAGFLVVTGIYWLIMLAYTGIVLGCLGADGAGCVIQTGMSGWKSIYHITFFQEYLLVALGGYVGSLFISGVTMLFSAKTRSAVMAVMVPFILIFIPAFLSNVPGLDWILGLLPDQLLQMNLAVLYFNLYSLGGKLLPAVPILFVLYGLLVLLLGPVLYRGYRKAEVR